MRIFRDILDDYGRDALTLARRWETMATREAAAHEKIAFVHRCMRDETPPKCLRLRPIFSHPKCVEAVAQYQKHMMRAMLDFGHQRIQSLNRQIEETQRRLCDVITPERFAEVGAAVGAAARHARLEKIHVLRQKTDTLKKLDNRFKPAALVHNLSSKTLTESQMRLLQRDAGFNLGDARPLDFLAAIQPALHFLNANEEIKDELSHRISAIASHHRPKCNLTREEVDAKKQLRQDKTIVILPADKGRATVVMDRTAYVAKAETLLEDADSYRTLQKDPLPSIKQRLRQTVTQLTKMKKITAAEAKKIRPKDSAVARFYGLPKIHKEGTPLRPIVSLRGSPMFGLAEWLTTGLKPLILHSETTARSSTDFLERIRGIKLADDEVMVSFDVVSLFTSIPQTLAKSTIRELIEDHGMPKDLERLTLDEVLGLLEHALRTIFVFNGQLYEQTRGTPMGSPVSGIIAEAVLQKLERQVLPISQHKFWTRYVDDTFVIVRRDQQEQLRTQLNGVFPEIQFTMEEEKDGRLPFLDVLVARQRDGSLETSVFRKPTHTDNLLHADSNHPAGHKVSCLRALFRRVETHCSTHTAKKQELATLRRMCRSNGYKPAFVKRCLRPRPERQQRPGERKEGRSEARWYGVPYISSMSEAVARLLAPHGIRLAHRPAQTLRVTLMQTKDPLRDEEKTGLIYEVPCGDCDGVYVGETDRPLQTRIQEHRAAVRRCDPKSLVFDHAVQHGHAFDFDQARIIDRDRTRGGRLFKEAWQSGAKAVNRHADLHPAFRSLRRPLTEGMEHTTPAGRDEQPPRSPPPPPNPSQ